MTAHPGKEFIGRIDMNILITTSSFSIMDFDRSLNVIFNPYGRRLTEDEVLALIKEYQPVGMIAGVEPISKKVLDAAENLKVISRCGIGMDSVDLKVAGELGIKVINTPDAPAQAVAELTLGLMLAVLRKIPQQDTGIRKGNWKGPKGRLLSGKTIGIVGCGRIGSKVAFICSAFGCRCLGYDPLINIHPLIEITEFSKLLEFSDIVTLHIPLTDKNRGLISENQIENMKNKAILINAARGGLVDEEALYNALSNGKLTGAGLDCFKEEPYNGRLIELDNIVLSPHMGSSTVETRKIMEQQSVDNLINTLAELELI